MDSPPTLTIMPPELLAKICQHLDPTTRSLHDLRLTCRRINSPASYEFGKRHFNRLSVGATTEGLQFLVKICQHHFFGPCVRAVELCSTYLILGRQPEMLRCLASPDDYGRDLSTIEYLKAVKSYVDQCLDQVELEKGNKTQNFLDKACLALASSGNPLILSVVMAGENATGAFDAVHFSRRSEFEACGKVRESRLKETIRLLLDAACKANCKVTGFEIRTGCVITHETLLVDSIISFHGIEHNLLAICPRL